MTDESDLVALLHRADWTQLSLSADVSDGSSVLIAPGQRYWYQDGDHMTGSDGGRPWELDADEDQDQNSRRVHWVSGPQVPLPRLLCPAWLLECSRLEMRGRTRFGGREVLEVAMTRRPSLASTPSEQGAAEVLVDAETGILLRVTGLDPADPEATGLVRADFAPVIEASRFRPPPGSRIAEGWGEAVPPVLRAAGGLAAGALGAWIRYSPFRRTPPASGGADLAGLAAADGPPPGQAATGPVSDDLLSLLHAGGPAAAAATLQEWTSISALAASVPASARQAGLGGVGLLMDAIAGQPGAAPTLSAVRFAGPLVYQIDRVSPPPEYRGAVRTPTTIACDGQRSWQVYPDKVVTGPAEPPPRPGPLGPLGQLADPSWLLRCALSGGEVVTGANGPAYRVTVRRRPGGDSPSMLFPAAIVIIDAGTGLITRLTWYIGDQPVQRCELSAVTTTVGEFRPHIPEDRPHIPEDRFHSGE